MKRYTLFTLIIIFLYTIRLNAIENISINNYNLIPSFEKEIKIYNIFVPSTKEIITINATPSENEIITGTGSKSLKMGLNEIEINSYIDEVLVSTYLLKITRGDVIFDESNSFLKSLTVHDYKLDFQKNIFEYHIEVNNEDRLIIDYETFNPKEVVKVSGDVILNKENNVINLKVISEDKKNTSNYKIYAYKKQEKEEKKKVKISIFDNENFTDDDLRFIRDIIIFIEIVIIILLFYFIVIKKKTNNNSYTKHSIPQK